MCVSKIKKQTGVTLLEAMVAMAVLIVGILVVAKAFPVALQIGQAAKQATMATNLAQAKIEECFSLGFDSLPVGTVETRHRLSADPANPFYFYEREAVVTYVDSNLNDSVAATGLKKANVTVYWKSAALSLNKNLNLSLIIAQK